MQILNPSLDPESGKPVIKKKAIAKLMKITKKVDLCEIWRICNRKKNDLDNTVPLVLFKDV